MTSYAVLFVCTGNICRSPSADGILRHKVAEAGLGERVRVDSAGTHDYHIGDPPDPRAIKQAGARGYDLTPLRARKLTAQDFEDFDLILGMDQGHMKRMADKAPAGSKAEVMLFMDCVETAPSTREVPDPYYGDTSDYDHALDLIEEGMPGLMNRIQRALG